MRTRGTSKVIRMKANIMAAACDAIKRNIMPGETHKSGAREA